MLAQLRLKLLDLSGRNRLINYKHSIGKSLQFVEGQAGALYERLVEGSTRTSVPILGLPDPEKRHCIETNGRFQRPDVIEWAIRNSIPVNYEINKSPEQNIDSKLRALMYSDDLAKHCRKIEREASSAIEETGANMLFLVLGFLEYPDQKDSDRIYSSPLVSIPVSMNKKVSNNGKTTFYLQYTGEDITDNLSLKEKLKIDYNLTLPDLVEDQNDEDQIDIENYFEKIKHIIRNQHQFSIKRKVSLSLLSFATMLLVRDLDEDNWPSTGVENLLTDHPLVKAVLGKTERTEDNQWKQSDEYAVEEEPYNSIPLVYDADSSQHSALVEVLIHKQNIVIEGPPGTGKSQTITNLIAASIASGKRVLFVAEKMAALEVVKNRLTKAGLAPFILELHSNKSNKKLVLEDIENRINYKQVVFQNLSLMLEQLSIHRNELKEYADLINSKVHNAFGKTIHQIMWNADRQRSALSTIGSSLAPIEVEEASNISLMELKRRVDCLIYLAQQYEAIGGYSTESTFFGFQPENLIPGNENTIIDSFLSAKLWLPNLLQASVELSMKLSGPLDGINEAFITSQIQIVTILNTNQNSSTPFYLTPGLFLNDKTGIKSSTILSNAKTALLRYQALQKTIGKCLKQGCSVSKEKYAELMKLLTISDGCGVTLGNINDVELLRQKLHQANVRINDAINHIKEFSKAKNIQYEDQWQFIDSLERFSKVVLEPPLEYFHLQSPLLNREGSIKSILHLKELKVQYLSVFEQLDNIFYLDPIPGEADLRQAVFTLREGFHWYSIFQSKWRAAIRFHKSLQKNKKRIPSSDRLKELEKLLALIALKKKFLTDPSWKNVLGITSPAAEINIDDYEILAQWNFDVRALSEELRIHFIDPETFTQEQARQLKKEYSLLKEHLGIVKEARLYIRQNIQKIDNFPDSHSIERSQYYITEYLSELDKQCSWLINNIPVHVSYVEMLNGCEAFIECEDICKYLDSDTELKRIMSTFYRGVETELFNVDLVFEVLIFGMKITNSKLSDNIKNYILSNDPIKTLIEIKSLLQKIELGFGNISHYIQLLSKFGEFDLESWVGESVENDFCNFIQTFIDRVHHVEANKQELIPWSLYLMRSKEAKELGLDDYVLLLEDQQLTPSDVGHFYSYCIYSSIIKTTFRNLPQLGKFTGLKHNEIRSEYQRLDKEIISLRGKFIAKECMRNTYLPNGTSGVRVNDKSEMALLKYLIPQSRPRMPVRKMLARAGKSIENLKPCFMMGPQAVAQYLIPGYHKFDLVIMDEASQLKPEEAIGAIARGAQLVVVGDAKQLPPTTFFSARTLNEEDDQFASTDLESILDVCSSQFDSKPLRWHYRSQHHSLIAFSNHNFYNNDLIVFPSPYGQGGKLGIKARYLGDAIYDNQMNLREAKRVVDAVIEHIVMYPEDSLGVVTLNIKQRDLIAELFEERLSLNSTANQYKEDWVSKGQPLFFKNLENVQGDERDAIIISTTFGKANGTNVVRQNFGPISKQGGWRRLNVLFTRAKKSISIFTSMRPEDIVVDVGTPEGTKTLRNYLEYARTGNLEVAKELNHEPDSDFEISVMDILKRHGYEVTPQLGVGGFRIDIAVKHPDWSGTYLAAIECDGATYHSAISVRDRDRIRQEILESMGWNGRIWRIWSTDWFRNPNQETKKLLSFLSNLRTSWKPDIISGEKWIEEGTTPVTLQTNHPTRPSNRVVDTTTINVDPNIQPELVFEQSDSEILEVEGAVIEDENELVVKVGDTVIYCDIAGSGHKMDVHITKNTNDFSSGRISADRPLAQILLGANINDQVVLNLDGKNRVFRVLDIIRNKINV